VSDSDHLIPRPDRIRVALAKDLIADVRRFDDHLAANAKTITALFDEHGTRLREIDGVGRWFFRTA
jgi:transposase